MTKQIETIIIMPVVEGAWVRTRPWLRVTVADTLDTWQTIVGGMIEAHPMAVLEEGQRDSLFLNEEGKLMDLTVNQIATILCQPTLFSGDFICGTVAIIGPPDGEGENTRARLAVWENVLEGMWQRYLAGSRENATGGVGDGD